MQFRLMTPEETEYWYADLMPEAFAANEIKPWDDVVRLLAEDRYEIWGLFEEPSDASDAETFPIGFACLWKQLLSSS